MARIINTAVAEAPVLEVVDSEITATAEMNDCCQVTVIYFIALDSYDVSVTEKVVFENGETIHADIVSYSVSDLDENEVNINLDVQAMIDELNESDDYKEWFKAVTNAQDQAIKEREEYEV